MRTLFFYFFIFFYSLSTVLADNNYRDYLIKTANEQKLYNERYWWILLHYKKGTFGIKSQIDDPIFFVSSEGKYNPKAELEATLSSFFEPQKEGEEHPSCKFIARYKWLKEKLNFDESLINIPPCERIKDLNPTGATIIFPTYYMNNPASMFGHTFLNIDLQYDNKLLSNAVNYSAFTQDTNGLIFTFKGLSGFYKGYYSVFPYYKMIQKYSDINQRDIWEYKLNLTESELYKMIYHIKELEKIYSYYYFFDENCSYNILYLIEAARPSVSLTDRFNFLVLPIDTVKIMLEEGMIDSVDFRPSKTSKIKHKISLLNKYSQIKALNIIKRIDAPNKIIDAEMENQEKIKILDTVIDYIQFQYAKKKMNIDEYKNIILEALSARSKLGKLEDNTLYNVPVPKHPEQVHDLSRINIAFGLNRFNNKNLYFQEIGYRPSLNDLLDTDYDSWSGTQIEFFNTVLRYNYSEETLKIKNFDFFNIISISPMDKFFKPFCWKANTGFSEKIVSNGNFALIYRLNTGAGISNYSKAIGLAYLFLEPELNMGGALKDNYSIGGGISAGILKEITPHWKIHLSGKTFYFGFRENYNESEIKLGQSVKLSKNNGLELNFIWNKQFSFDMFETKLAWNIFF
ncbi:MAG: DUF4105 domain-containing protein [Desulfobacterales bacterium]|nr:DUF4105 domain-containing protein [Desulfobacterales bacterium]